MEGVIVIRLVCSKCNHIWYTSNTRANQKCGDCGGILHETELIVSKEIETNKEVESERINSKVIFVDFK